MNHLYRALESESKKPGKVFHELVRLRRRELGLPIPPVERILPFRSRPSASLPAIDIEIDYDRDLDEHEDPDDAAHDSIRSRMLLQVERRIEELDVAMDSLPPAQAHGRRKDDLERAFIQELETHEALRQRLVKRQTE